MRRKPAWRALCAGFGVAAFWSGVLLSASAAQAAGASGSDDAALLSALLADADVRICACVLHATWVDQSYPRVVVDARRWSKLTPLARRHVAAGALRVAEGVYSREWGTPDIYGELFVVDRSGKSLDRYRAG